MDLNDALLLGAITLVSFTLAFFGSASGVILGHLRPPLLRCLLPSFAAVSATNLAISGIAALSGTVRHAREGRVSLRLLLIMGVPSVLGAILGVFLMVKIDPLTARALVGVFLAASGVNLLRMREVESGPVLFGRGLRLALEVLIGLALGILAAVTGLMMGTMRLPMMIRWLKIDPRVAVGSNMAIGFLTALAGTVTFWLEGSDTFHWVPLALVAPPTVLGSWLGARWTGRFNKESLTRLVGWTIALTGVGMVGEGVVRAVIAWWG